MLAYGKVCYAGPAVLCGRCTGAYAFTAGCDAQATSYIELYVADCLMQSWWCCVAGVKGAIALSQAVIAGGAIAGVAVTLHRKHPHDPSKPLMDFDIALMLLPFQLLGVSIG